MQDNTNQHQTRQHDLKPYKTIQDNTWQDKTRQYNTIHDNAL